MWRLNPYPPTNHPVIDDDHKLWLNDSIIDLYLHMVAEKYNNGKEPKKSHAFGAFFWSQLLRHGPKKVEGLTRRSKVGGDNLLRLDFLFIPANFNGNHWTLGVVRPKEKRLEFYDSMKGGAAYRSEIFFRAMREYLANETKGKAKLDKPWDQWWEEWTEFFVKDCPAQSNMHDCGVFTCKHAEVLARGRELSFTQADMPTIRYRMVAELLAGELGVA
ncbi:cysteine proteinase [Terfezia boudieri ATCC MYA-4762]|uniref:Cysteine proteinase n=1 Tax=Terfezia boudieri ATCC MYA-4762 TaxID=1051890 RepID=A0A3N4LBE0_9PEZI|nr:cysteine proteinase [Terfezia boudieri ATCC MYA-4762]